MNLFEKAELQRSILKYYEQTRPDKIAELLAENAELRAKLRLDEKLEEPVYQGNVEGLVVQ